MGAGLVLWLVVSSHAIDDIKQISEAGQARKLLEQDRALSAESLYQFAGQKLDLTKTILRQSPTEFEISHFARLDGDHTKFREEQYLLGLLGDVGGMDKGVLAAFVAIAVALVIIIFSFSTTKGLSWLRQSNSDSYDGKIFIGRFIRSAIQDGQFAQMHFSKCLAICLAHNFQAERYSNTEERIRKDGSATSTMSAHLELQALQVDSAFEFYIEEVRVVSTPTYDTTAGGLCLHGNTDQHTGAKMYCRNSGFPSFTYTGELPDEISRFFDQGKVCKDVPFPKIPSTVAFRNIVDRYCDPKDLWAGSSSPNPHDKRSKKVELAATYSVMTYETVDDDQYKRLALNKNDEALLILKDTHVMDATSQASDIYKKQETIQNNWFEALWKIYVTMIEPKLVGFQFHDARQAKMSAAMVGYQFRPSKVRAAFDSDAPSGILLTLFKGPLKKILRGTGDTIEWLMINRRAAVIGALFSDSAVIFSKLTESEGGFSLKELKSPGNAHNKVPSAILLLELSRRITTPDAVVDPVSKITMVRTILSSAIYEDIASLPDMTRKENPPNRVQISVECLHGIMDVLGLKPDVDGPLPLLPETALTLVDGCKSAEKEAVVKDSTHLYCLWADIWRAHLEGCQPHLMPKAVLALLQDYDVSRVTTGGVAQRL